MQTDIKIERSLGYGKGGRISNYIRPIYECFNRSRKATAVTGAELREKTENLITKWYYPKVIRYKIDGVIICSNSKENALKEYWRIAEREDVGKEFEVVLAD